MFLSSSKTFDISISAKLTSLQKLWYSGISVLLVFFRFNI